MPKKSLVLVAMISVLAGCQTGKDGTLVSKNDAASAAEQEAVADDTVRREPGGETVVAATSSGGKGNQDRVERYVIPEAGTVYTWRNNWANLPKVISYRVAGTLDAGGTKYVKFSSVQGFKSETHAFYKADDFSLKGYRDKSDRPVMTFKPTEQRYRFPMGPGDKWLTKWKSLDHKTDRVTSGGGVVHVMRWEVLELPAGKIRALKVKMPVQKGAPKGLTHYTWFSPELGITVKEEIGGGVMNWSQILEKVERPD